MVVKPQLVRCGAMFLTGCALLLALAGCRTPAEAGAFNTPGWEEHRLPNAPQPYEKLLVEIDAVDGTAPTMRELAELTAFLQQTTNKPGGVIVRLDDIISKSVARGRAPQSLALEFLNGPEDERTAFIYVLYHRSGSGRLLAKPHQPYFMYFPYPCAIFMDRSYRAFTFRFYHAPFMRAALQHEMGHALGLARNPSHCSHGHCHNEGCIMRPALNISVRRWLTFRPALENTEFCTDCRHDLEVYKSSAPAPEARLWRGYFLRPGSGYQILTLPGFVFVHFGDIADLDPNDIAQSRQNAGEVVTGADTLHYSASLTLPDDVEALARFAAEQKGDELIDLTNSLLQTCAEQAEIAGETDPEHALGLATEGLIEAAARFPDLQIRLRTLRTKLLQATASGP